MPRTKRSRRGSLAYVPKKRAKRIYPHINRWPNIDIAKIIGFSGYKAGMTQVLAVDTRKNSPTKGDQISIPVTVLDCPPIKILAVRFYTSTHNGSKVLTEIWDENTKKDKYLMRKLKPMGHPVSKFEEVEKNGYKISDVSIVVRAQPNVSGVGKKTPEVFELGVGGNSVKDKINFVRGVFGKELKINEVFKEGEYIDVSSVTKGFGTQGVVKRWGVKIQIRKAAKRRRHIGTLGPQTPSRVRWTIPQAGQLGFFTRTEFNKRVVKIGDKLNEINPASGFTNYGVVKGNYLLLEGSIPGPKKRLIMMRHALRPPKTPLLISEIKEIKK